MVAPVHGELGAPDLPAPASLLPAQAAHKPRPQHPGPTPHVLPLRRALAPRPLPPRCRPRQHLRLPAVRPAGHRVPLPLQLRGQGTLRPDLLNDQSCGCLLKFTLILYTFFAGFSTRIWRFKQTKFENLHYLHSTSSIS